MLRQGLSVEAGRDGLWTLTSLAVFDMLVGTCDWTVEGYERWLADRLIDMLLIDKASRSGRRTRLGTKRLPVASRP